MVNRVIHGSRVTAGTDAPGILENTSTDFPRTPRTGLRIRRPYRESTGDSSAANSLST